MPLVTHGHSFQGRVTAEYQVWDNIKQRCNNPNNPAYHRYGGRGIGLSKQWTGKKGFARFIAHVGPRPSSKHTIERIDNSKGYEPGNVKWATRKEQLRNTRRTRMITFRGKTQCLMDWSIELGKNYWTLLYRLRNGWSIERCLTT